MIFFVPDLMFIDFPIWHIPLLEFPHYIGYTFYITYQLRKNIEINKINQSLSQYINKYTQAFCINNKTDLTTDFIRDIHKRNNNFDK